ncbi:uncharacterized protein LOC131437890 [Malaya genurostris]|uniref:uncharacterized protein LOC131437890 n=1 Tax=Malaya genurostris TaxID=325434 RepID=UPI0026F39917|nr:uncharacterized protein LOC131437890 [Malaya genurostris]
MEKTGLSSFCRLCLVETNNRVVVFPEGNLVENRVGNLIDLVDIELDRNNEPNAVICFECIATLEAFRQFKDQCHENDKYMKTLSHTTSFVEVLDEQIEDQFFDEDAESENESPKTTQQRPIQSPEKKSMASVNPKHLKDPETMEYTKPPVVKTTRNTGVPVMPVLEDSYPDFFYFEKNARSVHFTMVFYGERYNSALYSKNKTYWQCIHRKKHHCDAQVCVSNDYKSFERRYEHSHGKLPESEGKIFTPLRALPKIFQTCMDICIRKYAKRQESKILVENRRGKMIKKRSNEFSDTEPVAKNQRKVKIETFAKSFKTETKNALGHENSDPESPNLFPMELAESYPDFFHFERGPRSIYYTLVYYGERYHSAMFNVNYTYWQCIHRRKYGCSAVIRVSNDYKCFERRREHTHGKLPEKTGKVFTPLQALPLIFQACRNMTRHRRTGEPLPSVECYRPVDDPFEDVETDQDNTSNTSMVKKKSLCKPLDTSKLVANQSLPASDPTDPSEYPMVLAKSYPPFFYFEKGSRSYYYTMVYYGSRFNSAIFTSNYTYWQCVHRRKYRCSAQICVTNDYQFFEQRHEHSHGELLEKTGEVFTPLEALPVIFEIAKKIIERKRLKAIQRNKGDNEDNPDTQSETEQEIVMSDEDKPLDTTD